MENKKARLWSGGDGGLKNFLSTRESETTNQILMVSSTDTETENPVET